MKTYGNAATIPGGSRTGIPLPKGPVVHARGDIASRVEAARAFTSPFVMHETREFTRDQLVRAGYEIQGERKRRGKNRQPRVSDPAITRRRADVVRLYGEGLRVRDVAEQLGLSTSTVNNDLDATGTQRRPTKSGGRPSVLRAIPDQVIVDLYADGLSCRAIGERLDSSESAVHRRLQLAGVELRATGGPRA